MKVCIAGTGRCRDRSRPWDATWIRKVIEQCAEPSAIRIQTLLESVVEGTYDVRLTQERPTPAVGQSLEARQWVEFVAKGKVVGREIAEVLRDNELPAVGASSLRVPNGTRVEMLKGGEFLRVSVKRDGVRYLVYLPPMRAQGSH